MKTTSEALKIVPHEDAEQPKNSLARMVGLNPGEELDPVRLMDLLGDIDGLKQEIHERMRRIEAFKEAKSWLVEDALRTESLNKRLTEIDKLMHAVHNGSLEAHQGHCVPEVVSSKRWENSVVPDSRPAPNRLPGEAVALAWPKSEESYESLLNHGVTSSQAKQEIEEAKALLAAAQAIYAKAAEREENSATNFQSASQRLQEAEQFRQEANQTNLESKQKSEQAASALAEAQAREEKAADELLSARQELTTAYQFASVAAQRRLDSAQFFERTARWALFAAVSSWIAMAWMSWVALIASHKNTPILLPILATIIFVLIGMVLVKRRVRDSEDR